MLVLSDVTNPVRVHTMTKGEGKAEMIAALTCATI